MIREAIGSLVAGESLAEHQAAEVMNEIMSGTATPAQIGALTVALRLKGETVDEIVGLASAMRAHAVPVHWPGPTVDTCGTGGDATRTFNISTTAAFVAAGAGVAVAKHGNRAVSSICGSADVLEALGVNIALDGAGARRCLEEAGVAFMFAPLYHPAMKYAAGPRREIGIRTVFNILGPLTNPAGASAQVLGVPDPDLTLKLANALQRLGSQRVLVVHGADGIDELSIAGPTFVAEVRDGQVRSYELRPEDVGLARGSLAEVRGGSASENAALLRSILEGVDGAPRRVVLLNAAAAILVGGAASSLAEAVELAAESIDSGRALTSLSRLIEISNRV